MNGYILDTNVLSEIIKKRPAPKVLEWLEELGEEELSTSVICVMELRFGAVLHKDGEALWKRIQREVLERVNVLSIDHSIALKAGEILADLHKRGEKISSEDALIAATALVHDLKVSSRNTRHFSRIKGLQVEDWWEIKKERPR